jgi:hypothetical protein
MSLSLLASTVAYGQLVEESFWIQDSNGSVKEQLEKLKELTVDHASSKGFELYGPKGTEQYLQQYGIAYIRMGAISKMAALNYPTAESTNEFVVALSRQYPNLTKLISIGKSRSGIDLYVLKISDNPQVDEQEPEFKYIANMHGDEILGRELMVRLARDILAEYASNSAIKELVDSTEIYIMPSMNPDGANRRQRGNARYVDLNRSFPDFSTSDNRNLPGTREPETVAVMNFQKDRFFGLSANFHGGAVVVNYPWDTTPDAHPLENMVVDFSVDYAQEVPAMRDSSEFPRGIVNGYAWYEVNGGMQDWSYHWHQDLQVTIELSDPKWPNYADVEGYYAEHKQPLIDYIKNVHQGVGIALRDRSQKGRIKINGMGLNIADSFAAEYYRVLPAGTYQLDVQLDNGQNISRQLTISTAARQLGQSYLQL